MRRTLTPAVLTLVLLGGCSTTVEGRATPAPPTATAAPTAAPTTPAPTTPAPTTATAPGQVLAAGTVADGTGTAVSGTGDALVTYAVAGELAVVGTLDCSACTGPVQLTGPGRAGPLAGGTAPWTGQALVLEPGAPASTGELVVVAAGSWSLTLDSWNDLPPVTGPQTVTGSAVLYLADQAPRFRVDVVPAGPDDVFSARVFSATAGNPSLLFGTTEALSKTIEVPLPAVLAVRTAGTWTVTPGG